MNVNIPIEFEKYEKEINTLLNQIKKFNDISIGFIGRSKYKENYKELYIVYNGYMNDIKADINFFSEHKYIYKMYPNEFYIHAKSAQVFMIYSTNKEMLTINEELIDYKLKSSIENKLSKLLKQHKLEDVFIKKEVDLIKESHSNISKTMLINNDAINQVLSKTTELQFSNEDYKKVTNKTSKDIKYNLIANYQENDDQIFEIKLENMSDDNNFKINSVSLTILYNAQEKVIKYNNQITLRKYTSKIIHFKISKKHFENIDMKNVKYKILIR